jgi:hypothetical protein
MMLFCSTVFQKHVAGLGSRAEVNIVGRRDFPGAKRPKKQSPMGAAYNQSRPKEYFFVGHSKKNLPLSYPRQASNALLYKVPAVQG